MKKIESLVEVIFAACFFIRTVITDDNWDLDDL